MRLFGASRFIGLVDRLGLPDNEPINSRLLTGAIEGAQKRIEDNNFKRRKHVLTYDDVMNQQRNLIYSQRLEVLNGEDISGTVKSMIRGSIEETVSSFTAGDDVSLWNIDGLKQQYGYLLKGEELDAVLQEHRKWKSRDLCEFLYETAMKIYEGKPALFGEDVFPEVERSLLLQSVDRHWMDHIDMMDDLKESVGLQSYAQRDPVTEYRIQGSNMFEEMVAEIREETMRHVLSAVPRREPIKRVQLAKPLKEGMAGTENAEKKKTTVVVRKAEKVGRNDLCPCGSGKKYKKCCGAPGASEQ